MQTARIVTDAGHAYIKSMGPHESPHLLAIEFIATRLAQWFKLPVLDFGIIAIDEKIDEIPLNNQSFAQSGPAFVTRAISAHPWGGNGDELKNLVNLPDIARLIVFDTWVRNCDRYSTNLTGHRANYDNVLLEHMAGNNAGKLRLIAMDHTHCVTCGRELDSKLHEMSFVQDDSLYGLFPGFVKRVRQADVEAAIVDLEKLENEFVKTVVNEIPDQWQVSRSSKQSLADFLALRARYVVGTVLRSIAAACWPDKLFDS